MESIGIIGGGVVGLCSAYYLQKEGYDITIMDEDHFNSGCSFVNAGMIVPSHVIPLAAPGVVSKGLRWMFTSDSPFAFHFSPNKDLLRWLWLFNRSATKKNVSYAAPFLRDISLLSKSLYREIAEEKGFEFGYAERGLLMLYQTEEAEKEETSTAEIANRVGIQAEILTAGQVQKLEPELTVNLRGGIYFRGDAHLEPGKFMQDLVSYLKNKGVHFIENTKVQPFNFTQNREIEIPLSGMKKTFTHLVIACGAKSNRILKSLSCNLPLQGGKGYSLTLENVEKNIHIPSLLIEGKVAVTPMGNNLRISGTMEIGNSTDKINIKKVTGILNTLTRFYPELNNISIHDHIISSGLRPCSPDGLPYIGNLKNFPQITIATGHGMMGMSLGPATGKLVSEMISGKKNSLDIAAFHPERFS